MTTNKLQKAIDRGVRVVGEEFIYRSGTYSSGDGPSKAAAAVAAAAVAAATTSTTTTTAVSDALWKEVTVKGVRPLHAMQSGEVVKVQVVLLSALIYIL